MWQLKNKKILPLLIHDLCSPSSMVLKWCTVPPERQRVALVADFTIIYSFVAPLDLQSVIADLDNFQFVSNNHPSSSEKLISSHKTSSFDKDDVFIQPYHAENRRSKNDYQMSPGGPVSFPQADNNDEVSLDWHLVSV